MQEKQMVNDALNSINSGLTSYASMISQTENQQLRTTLQQMRDQAEKSQYDLYTIAKNLGYYTPAQQASEDEIMKVKSEVSCSNCSECSCSNQQQNTQSQKPDQMKVTMKSDSLPKDIDEEKLKALQAPPKTETIDIR